MAADRVDGVLGRGACLAVVKRQFGFAKVRCRGLPNNATRAFVVLGLGNMYLVHERLGG